MKLRILSDIHLEFNPFKYEYQGEDIVIYAGDTDYGLRSLEFAAQNALCSTIFVPGNHDYWGHCYTRMDEKFRAFSAPNVYCLNPGFYETEDYIIAGVTYWTDFNFYGNKTIGEMVARNGMNDFARIKETASYRKFLPVDWFNYHVRDKAYIENMANKARELGKKLIVVSHHAPTAKSIVPYYQGDPMNVAFASNHEDFLLMNDDVLRLWIHGHIHTPVDYMVGDKVRVIANPRGYKDNGESELFNKNLIVEM